MNRNDTIKMTEDFVKQNLKDHDSGHDWWHIERVRSLAKFINKEESMADPFTLEIAAILHDFADPKFAGDDVESRYEMIGGFLIDNDMIEIKDKVIEVIRNVSFSKKNPSGNIADPVLIILQDADRLDAIGAIGVARAFNYGGFMNNVIYNPDLEMNIPSTISHFYEKLLLLKYRMNTLTAKRLAVERHEFLEFFLKQFYKEWGFGIGIRID